MKKFILVLIIAVIFNSCLSLKDKEMSVQEKANANIVGKVSTTFTTFLFFHSGSDKVKNKAYHDLLNKAQKEYGINAEVKNIDIVGSGSLLTISVIITPLIGHFEKITATADVVVYENVRINQTQLEGALNKAVEALIADLPNNSTIAILNMQSSDPKASEFAVDELEYKLVNSKKFKIADRRRIEQIRKEQNFQISGEVDDNSAVSIGKILGARIVITGSISGSGNAQRLYLRVLDVQTGQIIKMVREQF